MLMVIIGESSERAAIASDLYVRTAECRKDTKGHLQNFGVSIRCYTLLLLARKMADRLASRRYSLIKKIGDRLIKQILNSVIAKYRDLSVSRR